MKAAGQTMRCTLLVCAVAASADAQPFTGGIRGAVRDAHGVVPAVAISLTNVATNISRRLVTNDAGEYSVPAVPPGTYTLTAQRAGYKLYEATGLTIGTQEVVTLDIVLEVGSLEQSITVTGELPLVSTTNASRATSLDREALASLPAPGRNAFLLGVSAPTVVAVGDPQFNRQQDQTNASRVSIGGGGVRANEYLLDGVPITELRGRAVLNPTIEALEEVKVQVRTYDAETGRTGGGVFNATAKSGTNQYHGSGFYQTRPIWGQSQNFFDSVAGVTKQQPGLADTYYRLYGGGGGGPLVKNRTFFWAATEGYRSATTRNVQALWPSLNQRNGDFSHTTSAGVPVVVYNPWCRGGVANARCPATGTGSIATGGLFTNAVIPLTHPAVSQVGLNVLKLWPTETISGPIRSNEDGNPNAIGTSLLVDQAQMYTFKVDHKLTDRSLLSGLYTYNRTDEPGVTLLEPDKLFMNGLIALRRRPQVLVFNNTDVLDDTTVLTMRYGWMTWPDAYDARPFSAGLQSLGFSPTYVNALGPGGRETFPSLGFDELSGLDGSAPLPIRWKGRYAVNGVLTKLWGTHSVKVGGDLRHMAVTLATETGLGGTFAFDPRFTGVNGAGGNEVASLLLGLPASGSAPVNPGEGEWFTRYWAGYLQDDWRVTANLTVNYGVRLEHENGLREVHDRQTVAFDRSVINPLDALVPKTGTLLQGTTLRGGLIYAGVNGAPESQGHPKTIKPGPRVGATWALNSSTAIRGGYGLFWGPWNNNTSQHGQLGFSATTTMNQSSSEREMPLTTLDDPFPAGLQQPFGSSLGLLSGVGGNIDFVDQHKASPKVHQYSADVQHELPGRMALTIGYLGATGRDIGFCGTNDCAININQIDPAVARRLLPAPGGGWDAAALRESIANPFFGIAAAGALGTRATIQRGQLLRPFPEFGDILMHEATAGSKRQYHAVTVELEKRTGQSWWGGRYSYTYSRTRDNQFGESNAYASQTSTPQNNYDLAAEYGASIYDTPHRIVLAPIVRLPGPAGSTGLWSPLAAGWSASAIVELSSGAPLNAVLSGGASDANLGLFGGRQRPDLTGDPTTPGGDDDRVSSAAHPGARYFNAGAFADPGAGRYGNAPRTIDSARYQFRRNVDMVVMKDVRLAGRHTAQVRFEILNVTNTAKFGGLDSNQINTASFGRVTSQVGFMRIWQLSFRYRF